MLQIPLAYMGPAFDEGLRYVFRDPGFALFEGPDSIFTLRNGHCMSQVSRMRHLRKMLHWPP